MKSDNVINIEKTESNNNPLISDNTNGKAKRIVLAGNPNVGKSLIFNYLSGMYVDVSNFPGTTVAISKASYNDFEINDTPGIYGVSSFNDEEAVARDMIVEGDIVLNVVNAIHLERDLFLTLQLIDMGKKVSIILNFCDELKKRRIKINVDELSKSLGVHIVETSAVNDEGFDKLDDAIEKAQVGNQHLDLNDLLEKVRKDVPSQAEGLLVLEGDSFYAEKNNLEIGTADDREKIYIDRRNRVNELVDTVESEDTKKGELFSLIGRLSLKPSTGIPILLVVLTILYFLIGDLVSQRVVDFTENTLGVEIFEYNVKSFVAQFTDTDILVEVSDEAENIIDTKSFAFPNGSGENILLGNEFSEFSKTDGATSTFTFNQPFVSLFFGEFGVITMTITYLLFLLMPLVISFYFLMALLEDSGYLPRLATMLDRTLNKIGLNGKAVIPIMLGFGCVTMANVTTRILGSNRERSIVTAILQFVIPCSAQLAVIAILLSGAGLAPLLIYCATIFTVLIVLSTLLNKFLPGMSSPLLIDLPAIQIPKLKNVLKKTVFRTYGFMKEAGVWFFVGALGIGIMQITGLLAIWQNLLEPITTVWLKLPKEAANAFVMGMVRRDFGAAGLFDLNLTAMQAVVAITTITLFVPCIASFVVMLKERGMKEGLSIWFGTWLTSFLIGGILAQFII